MPELLTLVEYSIPPNGLKNHENPLDIILLDALRKQGFGHFCGVRWEERRIAGRAHGPETKIRPRSGGQEVFHAAQLL